MFEVDFNRKPRYSLNYEDFPPFPPPNVEFPPGYPPPPLAGGMPPSRKGSFIPDDIPGLPKIKMADPNAPRDKYKFVFITFAVVGMVNVLPMVFFITANEYWMYKFRTVGSNSTNAEDRNKLQANYASYNMIATTYTGIVCNFISTFFAHKIHLTTRAYMSLIFFTVNFIVQTVMVKVDTDTWQYEFFGLTIVIQVLMAVLMAVAGAGTMTIVAKFPDHYLKVFLFGQGVGGLISAILRLITITIFTDTISEAFLYFTTGCFVMGIGLAMFFFSTKTDFFKYYMATSKEEAKRKVHSLREIFHAAKSMWKIILLNFCNGIVPIGSITNLVVSEYQNTGSTWGDNYFVTVMSYLLSAICDIIGRGLSSKYDSIFSLPILFPIVIIRNITYATLFMFTRALPRTLPIWFKHDWQYGLLLSTYQLSGGYLMNVIMLQTFRVIPREKYEISLMVNMFFMGIMLAVVSPLGLLMVSLL
ncbi:hypothetical protein GWI33_003001 [Rhynchophorus ferrugineus]|uniref:Equilibrative nucleoside transporter 3-like protein n=2 Tax=Rhynchophorus ferrugineus TaxID=354439 RepID=A0A834IMD9_RHYFE|nr:hypothetical protein GWI33_003001 [Rhynchophorus ferrugineus]